MGKLVDAARSCKQGQHRAQQGKRQLHQQPRPAERQQHWQQQWQRRQQRSLHTPINFDSPARLPATDRKSDVTLMGIGARLPR